MSDEVRAKIKAWCQTSADRLFSGRLFLTIVAGLLLWHIGRSQISDQVQTKIFDIIEMIVMFYFLKTTGGKDEQKS
jgi:hypothetical protein